MKLHWEPITLELRTTFRVSHGASDQRHNVLVHLDEGVGEAAAVPYYGETQQGIVEYLKSVPDLDGSKYGRWAIEWVAQMPLTVQPVVRALHVVDVAGLRAPFMIQPMIVGTERYLQDEIKRMEASAKTVKKQTETLLKESGLKGSVIVDRGGVAASIMKHAKRDVTLLSIGSRGLDALDRFILGSVSNHAIHHAPCSVLVVKETPRPVRRILLAIDGSPASDKAVRFLIRYVNPAPDGPDREPVMVTIAHVMPFLKYPELREAGNMLVHITV